jgi:large subunit ribosomal protein L20
MSRVKRGVPSKKTRRTYFKRAKGFTGGRKRLWKTVMNAVDRAGKYAYRDRKVRKRDFRRLWIVRINAAARGVGVSYSQLMGGMKRKHIEIDRKVLSDIAISDPKAFQQVVAAATAA